jgi:hypothetical protein
MPQGAVAKIPAALTMIIGSAVGLGCSGRRGGHVSAPQRPRSSATAAALAAGWWASGVLRPAASRSPRTHRGARQNTRPASQQTISAAQSREAATTSRPSQRANAGIPEVNDPADLGCKRGLSVAWNTWTNSPPSACMQRPPHGGCNCRPGQRRPRESSHRADRAPRGVDRRHGSVPDQPLSLTLGDAYHDCRIEGMKI